MHAIHHILELLFRGPPSRLAQAAVWSKSEPFGGRKFQAAANAVRDVLWGFDVVALHVHDPDSDVAAFGDFGDDFQFGEFAAGHFDVDLVQVEIEKRREHWFVNPRTDSTGFVVPETQVRGQSAFSDDRLNGAIKDIYEPGGVFSTGVTTHRGFIHGDLRAARGSQVHQFLSDDRNQCFGQSETIRIKVVGEKAAAESVWAGDTGLENRLGRRQTFEPFELVHDTKAARGSDRSYHLMFWTLIMRWRAETAGRHRFEFESLKVAVERQVEIQACLFTVRYHVEARRYLIVDRRDDRIVLKFG